jgi:hypothetical protein
MIYKILHRKLKIEQHETTKNQGWTQLLRKGKQFLLHMWYPTCYSCYNPGYKSWMRKGPDCDYNKRNISLAIYDTDIP